MNKFISCLLLYTASVSGAPSLDTFIVIFSRRLFQIDAAGLDCRCRNGNLLSTGLICEVDHLLQHQLPRLGAELINVGGGHAGRLDRLENCGSCQLSPSFTTPRLLNPPLQGILPDLKTNFLM